MKMTLEKKIPENAVSQNCQPVLLYYIKRVFCDASGINSPNEKKCLMFCSGSEIVKSVHHEV